MDEVEAVSERYRPDRSGTRTTCSASIAAGPLSYAAELEKRKLRLPFECISRAERLDEAVADAFAAMGCWRVWIGSESGSQDVLDAMDRRVKVEQVREAAARSAAARH